MCQCWETQRSPNFLSISSILGISCLQVFGCQTGVCHISHNFWFPVEESFGLQAVRKPWSVHIWLPTEARGECSQAHQPWLSSGGRLLRVQRLWFHKSAPIHCCSLDPYQEMHPLALSEPSVCISGHCARHFPDSQGNLSHMDAECVSGLFCGCTARR